MSRMDTLKGWLADLARPFALYSVAGSTSYAIASLAYNCVHLSEGAVFIGAALGGLAALYVGKAFENTRIAGHSAEVEKVRAASGQPVPDVALAPAIPAAPPVDHDPTEFGGPRP